MMLQDKLNFLNKYTLSEELSVSLIESNDIDYIQKDLIPDEWREIFKEKNKSSKISRVLNIWKRYVSNEMSNTIAFLKECLIDVELMAIGDRYSILYSVKNARGKILYYEGRNPKEYFNNEQLEEDWSKIPDKIRSFYENVHSGFYYYPSKSMGLESLENITYLDDYEWDIVDEIGEHNLKIDFASSYGFFSNGMGTYVVVDYKNSLGDNATLWSSKEEPEYNLNFWDVVDEWMVIGFE